MKLIDINKTYYNKNNTVHALKDINIDISNTKITFILGESGCGKTTLLNIIAGIDQEFDGSIECHGHVEYIEQQLNLFENLSILDNLLLVTDNQTRIYDLLSKFQLLEPKKKVKKLSVGEKKRVQIIRSLLNNATYLICDEPTAALDHGNSELVMNCLKEVSEDIGVIVVTHDIALVDKYADYTIKMGKGIILENNFSTMNEENNQENIETKQSFKKQVRILYKTMKSRIGENIFMFGILFFATLIVFVSTFLFPSLNTTISDMYNWQHSKNVIVSQPNTTEIEYFNGAIYDLFHMEDVQLIKDNMKDVLAYRLGFDDEINDEYYFCQNSCFFNYYNIDEFRAFLEKYREEYERTGVEPVPGYQMCLDHLAKVDAAYPNNSYPKDRVTFPNLTNFIGLNTFEMRSYDYFKNKEPEVPGLPRVPFSNNTSDIFPTNYMQQFIPFEYGLYIDYSLNEIVPYQLFEGVELPLIVGKMPTESNEVLLPKSVADKFMFKEGYTTYEEIIGYEVELRIQGASEYDVSEDLKTKRQIQFPLKVCGVTYMDSIYENQIFFGEGIYDEILAQKYGHNPQITTFPKLRFIVDPGANTDVVTKQIERILDSKDSHFEVYMPETTAQSETYQNPSSIIIFTIVSAIALIVLYLMTHLLLNKRIKKENHILHRYQYSSFILTILKVVVLMMIVMISQIGTLSYLCNWLNDLANSIMIADIVSYDIPTYLFSFVVTLVIMLGLEAMIHQIRMKK